MSSTDRNARMKDYNPDAVGKTNAQIYGLPFNYDESDIVLIGVPFDLTASFGSGSHLGPQAIRAASPQIDLSDAYWPNAWKQGIFMLDVPTEWVDRVRQLRPLANEHIRMLELGADPDPNTVQQLNTACDELRLWVLGQCRRHLNLGKKIGVIGGEHSVNLGYLQALAGEGRSFGILSIDAHADLRRAYEGFEWSHASTFYNALKLPEIEKLVLVGTRDLGFSERTFIEEDPRIRAFYDIGIQESLLEGGSWKDQCQKIIDELPENVYVSFDVDGLQPGLCPNTGTPVPGGLSFAQASILLKTLHESGRNIIGFDLCEVSPAKSSTANLASDWNANVGARICYQLCGLLQ